MSSKQSFVGMLLLIAGMVVVEQAKSQITNNAIGINQTVCSGVTPNQINGTLPTGGSGVYQYEWIESTSNQNWGYAAAPGVNTNQNYQPPIPSTTTWYKRVVTDGNYSDTSTWTVVNFVNHITLSASGPLTFCPGDSVVLMTTVGGAGQSFQWKKGGIGLSNWANVPNNNIYFISAKTSGEYFVTLTLSNGCVIQSDTVTVNVNSQVNATISPTGPNYVCIGDSITLVGNVTSGLQYQWYKYSTLIPGATTTTYTANTTGTYKLKVTSGNCSAFSPSSIVNIVNPNATITYFGSPNFCPGGSVHLYVATGSGYAQWYNGTTILPGATTSHYYATTTGAYKVKMTSNGCSAFSNTINATLFPYATASIASLGDTVFCNGDSVILEAVSGIGYSYQWIKNSGAIGAPTQDNHFAAKSTGDYSVLVYNIAMCYTHANTITVLVHTPYPIITHTLNTLTTTGYVSYQWYFYGSPIAGATDSSITVNASGLYSVKAIDSFGCEGMSIELAVNIVGIEGLFENNMLTISPNPVHDVLQVNSMVAGEYVVENILGTKIVAGAHNDAATKIDCSNYAPGIYLLKFKSKDAIQTLKFLKE